MAPVQIMDLHPMIVGVKTSNRKWVPGLLLARFLIAGNHTHGSKCDVVLAWAVLYIHTYGAKQYYVPGKHGASFFMLCANGPSCTCDVDSSPKIEVIEHI